MIRTLYNGVSGVSAQMQRIDVTAHNLANINTTGYKKETINFTELLQQRMAAQGLPVLEGSEQPITQGIGTAVGGTKALFTQGLLNYTGRELDLSVEGDGFFTVTRADGTVFYTRDGNFQVDDQGRLVNNLGYVFLDEALPENWQALHVDEKGQITYEDEAGVSHAWRQIELALFARPDLLQPVGNNLYAASDNSGDPEHITLGETGNGKIRQGYLEYANVDLAEEIQYLIESQRVFQLNTRSITAADQMWNIANNLQK